MATTRALSYLAQRYLLRRSTLRARVEEYGLELDVATADVVAPHPCKYSAYERDNTRYLAEHLRFEPGDVMLDIGANIGWYSLLASRLAADTPVDIFAFEPDPTNRGLLTDNLALNGFDRVEVVPKAVGQATDELTLYLYGAGNRGRHSLLPREGAEQVTVPVTTVDTFWDEQGLGRRVLRFAKLDIEGYELMALRGGLERLAGCRLMLFEYSPDLMRGADLDPADLLDAVDGLGLVPHRLRDGELKRVERETLLALGGQADLFCTPHERV